MLRIIRNVVVRTVSIVAILAALVFGSYYACKGLSVATSWIVAKIDTFAVFAKANAVSLIVVVVVVTVANVFYEIISRKMRARNRERAQHIVETDE